ncbi:MAG: hypothetical protein HKN69_02065 [Desulfofustis sp.]|nr:hypothetical protein [Desulfofustis sp.]
MKLNDPFGRMERRHQIGYETVRDSLHRNRIYTEEGARKIIRDTKMRALKFVVGAGALLLLTYLLLPSFLIGVGAVVVLAGVWVVTWTVNGERYVKRYIEEELSATRPESKPAATE